MKKKWLSTLLASSLSLVLLVGCAGTVSTQTTDSSVDAQAISLVQESTNNESVEAATVSTDQEAASPTFDASDENTEYSAATNSINLSDYAANSILNITTAGEYVLSGTLDGQVVVDVASEDEVQLVLNNATITNPNGSAILVQNAGKVIITLNDGTVNTVTDGANYTGLDEDGEPDAAIFSHDDLTINGDGALIVQANYSDGIESRDDLKIAGGNITISAVNHGLFGNNSFEMKTATLVITAGGDTIHSDGDLLIESGNLTLNSGDDGMHADGTLTINDGMVDIQQSYEGIEGTDVIVNGGTINIVASDDGINGAGGNDNSASGGQRGNFSGSQASITINGGTITIAAAGSGAGDGLDANGTITINGGDIVIEMPASYRDYSNIDYNTGVSLNGGNVQILNVDGTYTQVTASNLGNMGGGGGRGHK